MFALGAPMACDLDFLGKLLKIVGGGIDIISHVSSELSVQGPELQFRLCGLLTLWPGQAPLLYGL